VRDAHMRKLGADHPNTLSTLNNVAMSYKDAGKLHEAIALLEQVRDARLRTQGADHPDTLTTLDNLATAYQDAGKLPEAIALHEQVRDARVKTLGDEHPATLCTLNNLGVAYHAAGKLQEAIALLEKTRSAAVTTLGAEHPVTLTTLGNLANAYQDAGAVPQAIALFEQAAAGIEKRQFQHQHAGRLMCKAIATFTAAKQLDKAESWQRKWMAFVRQQDGAASPAYARELAALGLNLLQQQKWTDAEPILRESWNIRSKREANDWRTFNTMSMLGAALLGQKNYAGAEPLLLKGYEGMRESANTIPPRGTTRILEALDRLMELATATNQSDNLKQWQAERAKLTESTKAKSGTAKNHLTNFETFR
jgi:eukaryotic-like serine/threonine-protein kinase